MAKKDYLIDIDLVKNQLLNAVIQVLATAPSSPSEGQIYYNSTEQTLYIRLSSTWLDLGESGSTNLSFTRNGTTLTVFSDTGTDAILPIATTTLVGLMSPSDKSKLDGIEAGATADQNASEVPFNSSGNDYTSTNVQNALIEVRNYVNSSVAGALKYIGGYNASTNVPNLDTTPSGILVGYTYTVTVAGNFYTEAVQIGDMLIAEVNNPASLSDWTVVNKNIPDIVNASTEERGIIEIATQAEVNTGTDTDRAVTPATLQTFVANYVTVNGLKKLINTIGNGSATVYTIVHNFNTDVIVQIYQNSSPFAEVEAQVEKINANSIRISFNTAPTTNQYKVITIG
jgi:hypothetical protein